MHPYTQRDLLGNYFIPGSELNTGKKKQDPNMQVLTDKQAIDYITMCCFNRCMDKRIINAPYI